MRNDPMWLLGRRGIAALVVSIVCLAAPVPGRADQVIPDDLVVQGSECVGLDCVNNESFGFDTIRLKENNLRIKFDDTSTGSFPSNDWQITANDSASGGANKFSIDDTTNARTPFTILAGAPTNSLFIDGIGRIGLRTATPALDLHFNTSNTPGIRLEQNSSVGFATQTWDVPDLVATSDRKGLSPMDIVAVLTKVVQEQQRVIAALEQRSQARLRLYDDFLPPREENGHDQILIGDILKDLFYRFSLQFS